MYFRQLPLYTSCCEEYSGVPGTSEFTHEINLLISRVILGFSTVLHITWGVGWITEFSKITCIW